MPLPEDVARLLRDQRFWLDYFSFSPSRPHTGLEAEIRLPVTGQHALALSINGGLRCQLGLSVDGGEPILLGWDDDAHWHPHVLRWAEVCRASAAIAARAPSLPHPGIPLLLLARFAPICSEEDARFAWALLGAAANRVTPRSARIRLRAFDRVDVRGAQLEWRKADVGMVLEQPGTPSLTRPMLYTLRSHDSEAFPFAEWRAMLQDLPEATRPPPPGPVPATQAQVRFQLQHSSGLPHQEVSRIEAYLSRVLADAGEGRSGWSSSGEGHTGMWCTVRGSKAYTRRRVAGLLAGCGALTPAVAEVLYALAAAADLCLYPPWRRSPMTRRQRFGRSCPASARPATLPRCQRS